MVVSSEVRGALLGTVAWGVMSSCGFVAAFACGYDDHTDSHRHVGWVVGCRVFSFAEQGHRDDHEVEGQEEEVVSELRDSFGAKDEEKTEDRAVTHAAPHVDEQTPQHRQQRQRARDDVNQQEREGYLNLIRIARQIADVGAKRHNIVQKIAAHDVGVIRRGSGSRHSQTKLTHAFGYIVGWNVRVNAGFGVAQDNGLTKPCHAVTEASVTCFRWWNAEGAYRRMADRHMQM